MDLIKGIQNILVFIEDNITDDLNFQDISKQVYVSNFHFQRIFSVLCGCTPGEYIRNRRLTLAGAELSKGESKVIDVALKYGYDSPDSFTKAFTRFHGVSPSQAKNKGARLKSYAPLKIKLSLEGGNIMEYKIVEKEAFEVFGVVKDFSYETSYKEVPGFWDDHHNSEDGKYVCGMFGICFDEKSENKTFKYMIADTLDAGRTVPDRLTKKTIPANTWAVFPCIGAMPKALQDVNAKIWNEWLPNCREYEISGDYNVEMYSGADTGSEDYYSEIWIPVKKVT